MKVKLIFCSPPSSPSTDLLPFILTHIFVFIHSLSQNWCSTASVPNKHWLYYFPNSLRCKASVTVDFSEVPVSFHAKIFSGPSLSFFSQYSRSGSLLTFTLTIVPTSNLPLQVHSVLLCLSEIYSIFLNIP